MQVWFPGVHCDVGGGYPEAESGLAKGALEWMLSEAEAAGLLTETSRVDVVLGRSGQGYIPPDPRGMIHRSLTGFWNLVEFVPKRHFNWKKGKEERRANLYRRRTIPPKSLIHRSAYERDQKYVDGLPDDAVRVP